MRPRALDLVRQNDRDVLYIAGIAPANRRAALWRLAPGTGEPPEQLLHGSPLALADGVAVASNGKVYVAGYRGAVSTQGVVLEVDGGRTRPLVNGVRLGSPAGIALTLDESLLLVSSLAADGSAQVLLVDLASGATSIFNDVIGANRASGGLHRAHRASYLAWVDRGLPGQGRIYGVEP
jgi:hypothetical protein